MTSKVAIFPWGEVIEVFLEPLGLKPEDFAGRMRGGWLFGYVRALTSAGLKSVIVYGCESVATPTRVVHAETGAPIWLVPARRSGEGRTRARPSLAAVQQWRRTPFAAFATVLRQEGCDAVLVQDYEHARFDALAALAARLGLPLYASFQGGDVTLSPLERKIRRVSLSAAKAVICASARERARLAREHRLAPERILDIPNPVDTEFWRPDRRASARRRLGLPADGRIVINHGRIDVYRKGLDVLVSAWARVLAATPDATLVVIGSGQDEAAFRKLVAGVPRLLWIDNYVTDPPRIRRWLSAADLYVTLSRVEGMPVAPLEGLACGLPLVASDAHGLADIFTSGEPGGLLVQREDPNASAAAMLRLLADSEAREVAARQARRTAVERYSLETVGRRLSMAFAGGAARRPRRGLASHCKVGLEVASSSRSGTADPLRT